ncbi:hypothetical protein F4802DRAFT_581750 [Xylaria palmicola]|nr:hypothetical protein F4802DRAFT_581750 [Xylaria palmicola]
MTEFVGFSTSLMLYCGVLLGPQSLPDNSNKLTKNSLFTIEPKTHHPSLRLHLQDMARIRPHSGPSNPFTIVSMEDAWLFSGSGLTATGTVVRKYQHQCQNCQTSLNNSNVRNQSRGAIGG